MQINKVLNFFLQRRNWVLYINFNIILLTGSLIFNIYLSSFSPEQLSSQISAGENKDIHIYDCQSTFFDSALHRWNENKPVYELFLPGGVQPCTYSASCLRWIRKRFKIQNMYFLSITFNFFEYVVLCKTIHRTATKLEFLPNINGIPNNTVSPTIII